MVTNIPASYFRILYFSSAANFTRKSAEDFRAPLQVTGLFDFLENHYPGIRKSVLCSCAVTVNLDYVDIEEDRSVTTSKTVIEEGDEVAIIPPVSSG